MMFWAIASLTCAVASWHTGIYTLLWPSGIAAGFAVDDFFVSRWAARLRSKEAK